MELSLNKITFKILEVIGNKSLVYFVKDVKVN